MEIEEIANDLIEIKEMLETLQCQYNIPDLEPLWLDPVTKLNHILEEIE